MPKTTPDIKIDAVRRQGGNVMLFGNSFDEAYGEAADSPSWRATP
jgi:threonine dehydratase